MKVEPLQDQVPRSLMPDAEAEAYFTRLHRWVRDMWTRTGGSSDAIEANQIQSLRPPSRTTSVNDLQGFKRGSGAPTSAIGNNGDFYFRTDGTGGSLIYHKAAGSWTAIA